MLSSRWYKIWHDLWGNKTRTLLIVLSIAVGLFAVGTIVSSQATLSVELDKSYAAINPSTGTVRTAETFDEDFVRAVRGMKHVADADARRAIETRIQNASGKWINLTIFAVEDYDAMRVNKVFHQEGAWPPPDHEILIERAALQVIKAEIGDTIVVRLPNENLREMRIAGTAHDMAQLPAPIDGSPYGYVSFETIEWFGEPYGFNELHIVSINREDEAFARNVTNEVKDRAEKIGMTIPLAMTAEPGQIPMDDVLQAILFLMGAIGTLSLFLSAFLIINTISALLTQQRRQIGVMKAIGASTRQLMGMYLTMVLLYGIMALLLSVPFSIVGSRALSHLMAALFNFDLGAFSTPPRAITLQVVIGLLVPVVASLYPFLSNLRVTAAEAMSVYQISRGRFGAGFIDHMLSGANLWFARYVLPRSVLLSLRNTFRSKVRLLLTLITLTLASTIFVSVFNISDSLTNTIDDMLKMWNFDAMIVFSHSYRVEEIQQEAFQVPGVTEVDAWLQLPTRRVRPDGSESGLIYMFAPRADSRLAQSPKIVEGRWLLPDDENAVVVTTDLVQEEPDVKVGSEIVLKIDGQERSWRVVGIGVGMILPMTYGNYPYVAEAVGRAGEGDAALVAFESHEAESVIANTAALERHFEDREMRVGSVATLPTERAEAAAMFNIVISLMLVMALLLAIVGGLGLMGTMSINVLERTREIGVLRAIGAPNRGVAQVFITEGITIGLLSWLFGGLLSIPLSEVLSTTVGILITNAPLNFTFSITGLLIWLALVMLLSALASYIPAKNASRLTVREVLAYE